MAKWGEGDPRWIVEERADATNVNNWHWTERNVTSWSEERLKALLQEVRVEGSEGVCQVTDVSKLEGEACINNRKGKLFYFFEWVIRANWTGTSKTGVKYRGTVDVANLSDENDADDLDISVALCADHPPTPLVQLMKTKGIPEVRRALDQYMKQLKTGKKLMLYLILKRDISCRKWSLICMTGLCLQISSAPSPGAPCSVGKASTTNIQLKETFSTTPDELYATFISQDVRTVKTMFFIHIEHDHDCMTLSLSLDQDHFATVILLFEDGGGETHLYVDIQGVPSGSEDSTREGWNRFYLQAIKQTFGY
uniref:Activator of HSP90 ATPase activity 1 n=1 Tax=Neogobius melanostomus TaxID=47308 RepID=A0A8C6S8K7_9GOBI